MKVKEKSKFHASKVACQVKRNTNGFKIQNVPKHESMGLLPRCLCTNKTQLILSLEWMSKRERDYGRGVFDLTSCLIFR